MVTISIDAMGGDHGLAATVPAAIEIMRQTDDVALTLVGDEAQITTQLAQHGQRPNPRLTIHHATEVVSMHDSPRYALRQKKDSSLRVAINLVKQGETQACVSSGNTGALMATARFVLRTIEGIDRPAICTTLPRPCGYTYVLDLGANIDTPPSILLQFGQMGSQLIRCLDGKIAPTVGLLNIGVEEMKGNEAIKAAAELFKASDLNYIGFVEADEIYLGDTDLVVCDGVLGNVALKASEGVAQMIMRVMKEEFHKNMGSLAAGLVARPVLNRIRTRLDHRRYNGASLLGLQGTVVKSHGGTDALGFEHAIAVAIAEVRAELVTQLRDCFATRAPASAMA